MRNKTSFCCPWYTDADQGRKWSLAMSKVSSRKVHPTLQTSTLREQALTRSPRQRTGDPWACGIGRWCANVEGEYRGEVPFFFPRANDSDGHRSPPLGVTYGHVGSLWPKLYAVSSKIPQSMAVRFSGYEKPSCTSAQVWRSPSAVSIVREPNPFCNAHKTASPQSTSSLGSYSLHLPALRSCLESSSYICFRSRHPAAA